MHGFKPNNEPRLDDSNKGKLRASTTAQKHPEDNDLDAGTTTEKLPEDNMPGTRLTAATSG